MSSNTDQSVRDLLIRQARVELNALKAILMNATRARRWSVVLQRADDAIRIIHRENMGPADECEWHGYRALALGGLHRLDEARQARARYDELLAQARAEEEEEEEEEE